MFILLIFNYVLYCFLLYYYIVSRMPDGRVYVGQFENGSKHGYGAQS